MSDLGIGANYSPTFNKVTGSLPKTSQASLNNNYYSNSYSPASSAPEKKKMSTGKKIAAAAGITVAIGAAAVGIASYVTGRKNLGSEAKFTDTIKAGFNKLVESAKNLLKKAPVVDEKTTEKVAEDVTEAANNATQKVAEKTEETAKQVVDKVVDNKGKEEVKEAAKQVVDKAQEKADTEFNTVAQFHKAGSEGYDILVAPTPAVKKSADKQSTGIKKSAKNVAKEQVTGKKAQPESAKVAKEQSTGIKKAQSESTKAANEQPTDAAKLEQDNKRNSEIINYFHNLGKGE